jgi:MoxR-like ATPase
MPPPATHLPPPDENELAEAAARFERLRANLAAVIFGQDAVIEQLLLALLARGHVLLEGLPGLGKTQLARTLALSLSLEARRVQFTPDLLPSDITGAPILQEVDGSRQLVFQPGPLFANLVLADEINRASPKTQSALLEAMQERRVTVTGTTRTLPEPFFVVATQNPIELEGTYPLPEAQLDRFLFKIDVGSNPPEVLERIVLQHRLGTDPEVEAVMTREELVSACALAGRVHLPQVVASYIARLVHATHPPSSAAPGADGGARGVKYGASPRAALALAAAARARALLHRRMHASIDDVRAAAPAVLRHRILLDYGARLEGRTTDAVVADLLRDVEAATAPLPKTLADAKLN